MDSLSDTFWLSLRLFRLSFNSITQLLDQLSISSVILRTSSHRAKHWLRRSMLSSILSETWGVDSFIIILIILWLFYITSWTQQNSVNVPKQFMHCIIPLCHQSQGANHIQKSRCFPLSQTYIQPLIHKCLHILFHHLSITLGNVLQFIHQLFSFGGKLVQFLLLANHLCLDWFMLQIEKIQ